MRTLLMTSIVLLSTSAFAGPLLAPEAIPQSDLRCALQGEASELVLSHSLKKVWIATDGIKAGLPLNVTKYETAKCLGCYSIKADIAGATFDFDVTQVGKGMFMLSGASTGGVQKNGGESYDPKMSGTCMETDDSKPVFTPSLCSPKYAAGVVIPGKAAVKDVCVGSLEGAGQAIQLTLNDGTVRTYEVDIPRRTGPMKMGSTVSRFTGANVDDSEDKIIGQLNSSSGITLSFQISFATTTGLNYQNGSLLMVGKNK